MRIVAVCPTLNRPEGVKRLVKSLEMQFRPAAHVVIAQQDQPRPLVPVTNALIKEAFTKHDADICVFLSDHVELHMDCLYQLEQCFAFELDLLTGLHISNMDPLPNVREFCFPAIGREFAERFPDYACWCPDYDHFYADTELGLYARSIDRFAYRERASLTNYHFANKTAPRDATHDASRKNLAKDRATWNKRQSLGLLWGNNFELVS